MAPGMSFEPFIESAWEDHAERPEQVAERLAASQHLIEAPAQIGAYARLVAHVYGEHLGRWQRGVEVIDTLRRVRAYDASSAVEGPLGRAAAALRYAGGDAAALDGLGRDDRIAVLAQAASAWAGRLAFTQALAAYATAVELAEPGLDAISPALRALAAGGNNLAAALEEMSDRDDAQASGMVFAAEQALRYWKLAGTWLEEERAEFRLARSLLAAGRAGEAVAAATRCAALCRAHDAPALEHVFAQATLARAHRAAGDQPAFLAARAAAHRHADPMTPEDARACDDELRGLAQLP